MSRGQARIELRARLEIVAAIDWWQQNRPFAPHLLEVEIERALTLIEGHVLAGSRVKSHHLPDLRRFPIGRSGYSLYYRPGTEAPVVLSLWHDSRGRGPGL